MAGAIYPDLEGKTVIVTGGGSGIGAEITRHFARQKSKVGIIDIAEEPSKALMDELNGSGGTVHFEATDVTDTSALQRAIGNIRDTFGPVGVLINNAAHDKRHTMEEVTPDYWDERIAVNLKHQFFAAQAVAPDMKAAGGGVIINFGSISWMIGQGDMPCYTTSKSAVMGLTRSLARDLGPDNIRVLSIAPGWILTQRQIDLWLDDEGEKRLMERQCLKRKLYADDIAKPTVFLASEEASACTNQTYVIDGGWL